MNGVIDAVWPVVEPALTPELVFSVLVTLSITHLVKIMAEAFLRGVTTSAKTWRAFCAGTSVIIGTVVGAVAWAATEASWAVIPIVAFCSGPVWAMLKALMPSRMAPVRDAFMTATDRKYQRRTG